VQHVSVLAPAGAAKWSVAECPGIPRLTASQPVPQGKLRMESLGKDIAGAANAIAENEPFQPLIRITTPFTHHDTHLIRI
jgi:hypothetical protein